MRDMLIGLLDKVQECGMDRPKDEERYPTLYPSNEQVADHLLQGGVIVQAQGHWIETQREWDFDPFYYTDYQCSVCGMREQNKSPFCRWCGTQMKEERSNENAD